MHDYPGAEAEAALAAPVVEIVLPQEVHRSARDDLWRMNLTAASFFPGLDGFARSLLYFVGLLEPAARSDSWLRRGLQNLHGRGTEPATSGRKTRLTSVLSKEPKER